MPAVQPEAVPGVGTEFNPFRMEHRSVGASGGNSDPKRKDLYVIGGHNIERNPAGEYADYMTDVVEAVPAIGNLPTGLSTFNRPRSFPQPDRKNKLPIYRQKYERMAKNHLDLDNKQLAKQTRELLKGAKEMSIMHTVELPGTVAALFLAEALRERRMLPIGLMLLDFVELGVSYGTGTDTPQRIYTWEKLMSNPGKVDDRISGGKHPMLHDNTQNQAQHMFEMSNPVTTKSISILAAWLNCYLHADPLWSTEVVRNATAPEDKLVGPKFKQLDENIVASAKLSKEGGGLRDNPYDFYNSAVKPALDRRCQTLDCLLKSNTLTYYKP